MDWLKISGDLIAARAEIERLRTALAKRQEPEGEREERVAEWLRERGYEVRAAAEAMVNAKIAEAVAVERERCEDKIDRLEEALHRIAEWSRAYPLSVFPKPDLKKAAEVLKANGMTLDAISVHAMRHVVEGVGRIAAAAIRKDVSPSPASSPAPDCPSAPSSST